jgi:hypothetical protein
MISAQNRNAIVAVVFMSRAVRASTPEALWSSRNAPHENDPFENLKITTSDAPSADGFNRDLFQSLMESGFLP